MPADEPRSDAQIIADAYEERVRELFKVFAETLYTGEPERDAVARFKRALLSVRRVRALALEAAKEADTP
ncbi:MAG TPA: hypothetical protein VN900_14280 [Stellaceae bacterium]|jgi:hypothetical protein|nr:hypothetical protein [Stellaceae bacterium]